MFGVYLLRQTERHCMQADRQAARLRFNERERDTLTDRQKVFQRGACCGKVWRCSVLIVCCAATCCRKTVDKLMRDMLLEDSISHSLVKSLLSPYLQLHSDNDMFLTSIAEIISDIREPLTVVESQVSREDKRQLDLKVIEQLTCLLFDPLLDVVHLYVDVVL